MLHDNNLIERLYDSIDQSRYSVQYENYPVLQDDIDRTRDDLRLRRNLPLSFMVIRQNPTQIFKFRILLAMNLEFQLQTKNR